MRTAIIIFCFILFQFISCDESTEKKIFSTQNNKPNIIFILADDLGYGDISCYNLASKIITPNIDKLAKEGIIFLDAHSPSAVCTPTRYGFLTGRYAWRGSLKKGVIEGPHTPIIEDNRPTIASKLKEAGYATGIFGKWHLGMTFQNREGNPAKVENGKWQVDVDFTKDILNGPNQHGFDYSFVTPGCPTDDYYNFFVENSKILGPVEYSEEMDWMESTDWKHEKVDTLITSKALSFIKNNINSKSDNPFFAYLALSVPHIPWLPPEFVKGKSEAGLRGDQVILADWCLKQINELLDELNIAENTLIIFTSDNGPRKGENGHSSAGKLRGLKGEVWEGGHRVPFIVKWPGKISPNNKSKELICLTDMISTFAEIAGYSLGNNSAEDSYNIVPALLSDDYKSPIRHNIINHSGEGVFCMREDNWKLIVDCDNDGYQTQVTGKENGQLYNLKSDPYEQNNLIDQNVEVVQKLRKKLDIYIKQGYTKRM